MKRMKNVVPYVVMVTGLTAIFVWSKWRQAENREVRAVSVVTPAPAADGIMLIDAGDLAAGADALRTGAIISAAAIPFLALSLFSTP